MLQEAGFTFNLPEWISESLADTGWEKETLERKRWGWKVAQPFPVRKCVGLRILSLKFAYEFYFFSKW